MNVKRRLLKRLIDIPLYRLFRGTGAPYMPPMQITLSVTDACQWRCKTCGTWSRQTASSEMGWQAYEKVFKSLPGPPFLVTVTGGEPFDRDDIADVLYAVCEAGRPNFLKVLTAGSRPDRAAACLKDLAEHFRDIQFLAYVSLHDIGPAADEFRGGTAGSFESSLTAYRNLKRIGLPNLRAGIQLLASPDSVDRLASIVEQARLLYPDLVGFDIAYSGGAIGAGPAAIPSLKELERVAFRLPETGGKERADVKIMNLFETLKFRLAVESLRRMKQARPCYAGFAAVFIHPDGLVTECQVASRQMGRLQEFDCDLYRLLSAGQAARIRREVKESGCFCPMAHCGVSNVFLNGPHSGQIAGSLLSS